MGGARRQFEAAFRQRGLEMHLQRSLEVVPRALDRPPNRRRESRDELPDAALYLLSDSAESPEVERDQAPYLPLQKGLARQIAHARAPVGTDAECRRRASPGGGSAAEIAFAIVRDTRAPRRSSR